MKSQEQHVDGALKQSTTISRKTQKSIAPLKLLESFQKLTNSEKLQRINEAVNLLHQLKQIDASDDDQVWAGILFSFCVRSLILCLIFWLNINIVLLFFWQLQTEKSRYVRRLIMGLGSTKSDSRTGYYTTLVGLLSTTQAEEYPTIADLFALMDEKLIVTTSLTNLTTVSPEQNSTISIPIDSNFCYCLSFAGNIKFFNWPNSIVCRSYSCKSTANHRCWWAKKMHWNSHRGHTLQIVSCLVGIHISAGNFRQTRCQTISHNHVATHADRIATHVGKTEH